MNPTPIIDMFSDTGELSRTALTMKHVKPEALEVEDIIHIDPYDLKITHIRPDTTAQGETEYVLSTTHYFFVWPVESTLRVRADTHLKLVKRS